MKMGRMKPTYRIVAFVPIHFSLFFHDKQDLSHERCKAAETPGSECSWSTPIRSTRMEILHFNTRPNAPRDNGTDRLGEMMTSQPLTKVKCGEVEHGYILKICKIHGWQCWDVSHSKAIACLCKAIVTCRAYSEWTKIHAHLKICDKWVFGTLFASHTTMPGESIYIQFNEGRAPSFVRKVNYNKSNTCLVYHLPQLIIQAKATWSLS